MSSNVKAKKRLIQVVIAFIVLCLAVTGVSYLWSDFVHQASAATYNYNVANSASGNNVVWSTAVGGKKSGDIVNITLASDINVDTFGGKLTAIGNGVTVNLNMNGKTIYRDYEANSASAATEMLASYPASNNGRWGMISVNSGGTLNITGSGTIRNKKISVNVKDDNARDNWTGGLATIVNNGTVIVGRNVTIEAYFTEHESWGAQGDTGSKYHDGFVYCHAIYNNGGTVKSEGTIKSGAMYSTKSTGRNSYHYAIAYGIYGGTVETNGGRITAQAYSGGSLTTLTCAAENKMAEVAVGIYSNNAKVLGDTSILTETRSWNAIATTNGAWHNGSNFMMSAGVMYLKNSASNRPVIGPAVKIDNNHAIYGGSQISVPGSVNGYYFTTKARGTGSKYPGTNRRYGYAIVGVEQNNNTAGTHTSEQLDDTFFGNLGNVESYYKPEESYLKYPSSYTAAYIVNASSNSTINTSASGIEELYSDSLTNGTPDANGAQYITVYRFYNELVDPNNLLEINFGYDATKLKANDVVYMNVNGANRNGNISGGANLSFGGGGAVRNPNYYEFDSATYETTTSSAYALRDKTNMTLWRTNGNQLTGGISVGSNQTAVVYLNYVKKAPSYARVAVASSTDAAITKRSEGLEFTADYTGSRLVPNQDFQLAIIDMGSATSKGGNINKDDDEIVTDQYNVAGKGGIEVTYKYRDKNDPNGTWKTGLPKDAGQYEIEIGVASDTTYSDACKNRVGITEIVTCTIEKAEADLNIPETITTVYGDTLSNMLGNFANFKANGKGPDKLETAVGTNWKIKGYTDLNTYLGANELGYTLTAVWTPTTSSNNYKETTKNFTLIVKKRDVYVSIDHSNIGFGEPASNIVWQLDFNDTLAPCDADKVSAWLNTMTAEIKVGSTWQAYNSSVEPGTYEARIKTFPGDGGQNNIYHINNDGTGEKLGELEVGNSTVYYIAEAQDRPYEPNNREVSVTLKYSRGAVKGDNPVEEIKVTGTVATADAGNGKTVTINLNALTEAETGLNMANYEVALLNSPCTVNITKVDPKVTPVIDQANVPYEIVYNSNESLSTYTVQTKNDSADIGVTGTWTWESPNLVPACTDSANGITYLATFTPSDAYANNYNTVTKEVAITVVKRPITITIPAFSGQYGDSYPALASLVEYSGFEDGVTIDDIKTEGNLSYRVVNPVNNNNYQPGNPVGDYPIVFTCDLTAANYSFTAENSTYHVGKRDLTITVKDKTIAYGDPRPTYTIDDIVAEGFYTGVTHLELLDGAPVFNFSYQPGSGAGIYDVEVSGYSSANYEITYIPGKLIVEKAVLTVTPKTLTVGYGSYAPNYLALDENGGKLYTILGFKGSDREENVDITGEPYIAPSNYTPGSKVGTYSVYVDATSMSSANYTFEGVNGILIVEKATPEFNPAPYATIYHLQYYSEAVFHLEDTLVLNPNNDSLQPEGVFTLKDATEIARYNGSNTSIKVDAIFTPTGDDADNYNETQLEVWLRILEKDITGKPIITGSPMVNQTLTASVSDTMDSSNATDYEYQWYVDGNPVSGATNSTFYVSEDYIGKQIHVRVTAKAGSGYKGWADSEKTAPVVQEMTPVTKNELVVELPDSTPYDGNEREAFVTRKEGYTDSQIGEISIRYNGSPEKPVDAGTYTVTVDIAAPATIGEGQYAEGALGPVSGLNVGTFTITKRAVTAYIEPEDKIYDGRRTATATINFGSELLGEDVGEVRFADGYIVRFDTPDVGVDKPVTVSGLALTGSRAFNYEVRTENGTATITPRTLTATASGETKTYDGSVQVKILFSGISGYADVDNSSTVYFKETYGEAEYANAGTRNVIMTSIDMNNLLEGPSARNYVVELRNDSITVVINKATPNIDNVVIDAGSYNSARALKNLDIPQYSNGYWKFDNEDEVPTVPKKLYAATFYPDDSENYESVRGTITVNVTKAMVTVTANSMTISYGSPIPTYTYTAKGLTGNDRIEDMPGVGISYNCTYYQGAPVGQYPIIIHPDFDSENYAFEGVNGMLVVDYATLYIKATAENRVYDPGNTAISVAFEITGGKLANDDVGLESAKVIGTAATANAGVTTVTFPDPVLTGASAPNYRVVVTPASGELQVEILKKRPEGVVFPQDGQVEFGYDLTHVTFKVDGTGDGTFAYEDARNTVPPTLGYYYNYYVVFTPTDSRNYESLRQIVTLEVIKCKLNYVVGVIGTPQDGQMISTIITGMPSHANEYIKYQWFREDGEHVYEIDGAVGSSYLATSDDIGCYLIVLTYFDDDAPYEFADTADLEDYYIATELVTGIAGHTSDTIKAIKLSFWQKLLNWIYRIIAAITGLKFGVAG